MSNTPGAIALVGGAEWREGCEFDAELAERSGGVVTVLPTAAAYERPDKAVEVAKSWFASLGARAEGLMVLSRSDAEDEANAQVIRASRFVYLSGGSPLHLRSVLKGSRLWAALRQAWERGAVIAGSSAGAMVLGDPMVDPRGGAYTLGLGLIEEMAVVPHSTMWSPEKLHRVLELAPAGLPLARIDERTALIREPDGSWRVAGAGQVSVVLDGREAGLEALPR